LTIKGSKLKKGSKQAKNIKWSHKSETKVITRRRAFALLALKISEENFGVFNIPKNQALASKKQIC
jgi:hypothetical protein